MNLFDLIVRINKQAGDEFRKELGFIVGKWYQQGLVPYYIIDLINVLSVPFLTSTAENLLHLHISRRTAILAHELNDESNSSPSAARASHDERDRHVHLAEQLSRRSLALRVDSPHRDPLHVESVALRGARSHPVRRSPRPRHPVFLLSPLLRSAAAGRRRPAVPAQNRRPRREQNRQSGEIVETVEVVVPG